MRNSKKIQALILDDVLDALPTEIMRWFIAFEEKESKDFIFDCDSKILIPLEGLSFAEVASINLKTTSRIQFSLKANLSILDDFEEKYDEINGGSATREEIDEHFWSCDLDDIFHDYQEVLEAALDDALQPFFSEAIPLREVFYDAREAYLAFQPYEASL